MPVLQSGTKKEDVVVSAEDREFMILEPRFLEKPAFAVEQSRNAARKMAEESHNALFTALSLVDKYSEEGVERVENMESKVDRYEDELGTYLVKLSQKRYLRSRQSQSFHYASLYRGFLNVFPTML